MNAMQGAYDKKKYDEAKKVLAQLKVTTCQGQPSPPPGSSPGQRLAGLTARSRYESDGSASSVASMLTALVPIRNAQSAVGPLAQ
jgi:hypothetical protein